MSGPAAITMASWILFSSWRTLPGQLAAHSRATAPAVRPSIGARDPGPVQEDEVLGQERDVGQALAQRRQLEREDVDAVHQVLAELAGRHQLGQIAVSGGDDPDVDLAIAIVAQAPVLAELQDSQELGLGGRRQLADLVEKQGAARRPRPRGPRDRGGRR
jgi:hypothetical protein